MSIPKMTNDLAVIQKLSDLPNSTEGLTAEQLKAKFDEAPQEIQKYINEKLIPAIVAEQIPFTATSAIDADNVGAAIREVQSQLSDASSGAIVNGSVSKEKLSAELLERTYGGRPWVSMDTPSSANNPGTDLPIGQIWLRPAFTVTNVAGSNWTANGCTVTTGSNKVTVKGNQTVVTMTATQSVAGIGQDGDRVYVLFNIQNKNSKISALTVSLNNGSEQDAALGAFGGTLAGGALSVRFSATWPSTSQASGSFDIANYTVVNVDQIIRQTVSAREVADWAGYLRALLPLNSYSSPEAVFIQSASGVWYPLNYSLLPVSKGGTGLNALQYGEMLYGGTGDALERLSRPASNNSVLQFASGKPAWKTIDSLSTDLGVLKIRTGTYTGTETNTIVTLPIAPKLLYVYTTSGVSFFSTGTFSAPVVSDRPCLLANGATDGLVYGKDNDYVSATVKLSDTQLWVSDGHFCNRNGVRYNWIAIY